MTIKTKATVESEVTSLEDKLKVTKIVLTISVVVAVLAFLASKLGLMLLAGAVSGVLFLSKRKTDAQIKDGKKLLVELSTPVAKKSTKKKKTTKKK